MHRTTSVHTMHAFCFGLKVNDLYGCVAWLSKYWIENLYTVGKKHTLGMATHARWYAQIRVLFAQ